MAKLKWDEVGKRVYETGVKQAVLYVMSNSNGYGKGVAWSGMTAVTESPSGAEATPLYADDTKYLELYSAEEFGATVEAYTYPDEFGACDGTVTLEKGVTIGQQTRSQFALCYRTAIGNDTNGLKHGYKLHIIYGCRATPTEKAYNAINNDPEAITFSWEITTTPVPVTGQDPTSTIVLDSTKLKPATMQAVEAKLYGDNSNEPQLLMPDEIIALVKQTEGAKAFEQSNGQKPNVK